MLFVISLVLFIVCCVVVLFLMKKFTNVMVTNLIFVLSIFLCYVALVVKIYRSVGAHDWNFYNALPTANVSPFMFCTSPLGLILPKKAKQPYLTLVSLLSVGMFLAPVLSCVYFVSIKYGFFTSILLDYFAHFTLFLWGIYLVRSGQVDLSVKKAVAGGSVIVCVALVMMVLNLIFDTSFFGLSLRGKHNIYNMVLTPYSALSVVIYFVGLVGVLTLGYFFQQLWTKPNPPRQSSTISRWDHFLNRK